MNQGIGTGDFRGLAGDIHVRNFTRLTNDALKGEMVLSGTGNPVSVEDTGLGLLMTSKTMNCTLVQDAAGRWMITKATLDGNADVRFDSSKAAATRAEVAARNHLPTPPAEHRTESARLLSNHLDFTAGPDETEVASTAPLDYSDSAEGVADREEKGKSVAYRYAQQTHVVGSAGRLTLNSAMVDTRPGMEKGGVQGIEPRIVRLDGPVKFDLTRTETPTLSPGVPPLPASAPTTTVMHGLADRFDANFLSPGDPSLTLTGNVAVDGTRSGYSGTTTCNQMTIYLDRATRKTKTYEFLGGPATTTLNNGVRIGGGTP